MVYDLAGDLFARLQRLSLLFHGRRRSAIRSAGSAATRGASTRSPRACSSRRCSTSSRSRWSARSRGDWTGGWRAVALAVAPLLGASAYFFGRRLASRRKSTAKRRPRADEFRPHDPRRDPAGAGVFRRGAERRAVPPTSRRRRAKRAARTGDSSRRTRSSTARPRRLGRPSCSTSAAAAC